MMVNHEVLPTVNNLVPLSITLAEQKVLGAIIINQANADRVIDFLEAKHFSCELHQEIYRVLLNLIDANIHITPITISNSLEVNSAFQEFGGPEYLANLTTIAIAVIDIRDYGRIVYDAAIKRQLIIVSQEAIKNASNASVLNDAKLQLEVLESKIYALINDGSNRGGFVNSRRLAADVLAYVDQIIKSPEHLVGISTGFSELNSKLGGFHNADLVVLAGRPSMGKTAFALNLAVNACESASISSKKGAVGFFSLEMSAMDLMTRIISMKSGVDSTRFIDGKISEESYNNIRTAIEQIHELPIFIDDSPALTISVVRSRARKLKRQHNLSILFIDYLQLIKCTEKVENRVLEVSEITRSLKALAKELDIPIIALSQLSRAVEQRADKRPILSDLRESGSIEQDADVVMFLYREEYYLRAKEPEINTPEHIEWVDKLSKLYNVAEIIITKHRRGPMGNIKLHYDSKCSKFCSMHNNCSLY